MFRTISSKSSALKMISAIERRAAFLVYRVEQLLRYGQLTLGWRASIAQDHLFTKTDSVCVNPSSVLLPVAIRILRKPHPGFVAIASRNVAEPAVLFDPRGSFGHQGKR